MQALRLMGMVAAAVAVVHLRAGEAPQPPAAPLPAPHAQALCQPPDATGAHPLADRAGRISRYEQLPRDCLEAMFRACTSAATEALLDMDSAATCSIGYEALLRRGFAGDFGALMAWWRSEPRGVSLRH